MELNGKVKFIGETVQVSGSFKKRDLVVTTDEQYPQHILIEFTQDKCDLLNNFKLNDNVTVGINIRGREWINPQGEAKYFNSIQGWKIFKQNGSQAAPSNNATTQTNPQPSSHSAADSADDLPF